ncbi:hypothetical protein GUITHDRAFT_116938 [Guillardia theta CCMP2712]|uniref:Uncharacterized protein n=1 Tax=Guillardia theta (strain CCMP2712) TaxID=905079 RepID=L1IKZ9_GUITC|nr:hypothetical protein GUITHDRAFT_116938 [Guillardia theta CCMP2712]EKX36916.1 hypothetical protein GUITHDRAFT_116938 [Guillardia theta CCMP2712]|eukprot:XP_005823896.1 hypothetical protein GUITHDRAFT_116938 [Guillardia theta CCMP2712]
MVISGICCRKYPLTLAHLCVPNPHRSPHSQALCLSRLQGCQVALAFAEAVSRAVPSLNHLFIPRQGRLSMYDTLSDLIPAAVRSHSQVVGGYGVREVEFNKILEHNVFPKIRDRCILPDDVEATDFSRSSSARYFFSNRRWRNPDDPRELQELRQAWLKLRQLAWRLGADVSLEALEQCCRERYGTWVEMTTNWSKAARRVYRKKRRSRREIADGSADSLLFSSSLSGESETESMEEQHVWDVGGCCLRSWTKAVTAGLKTRGCRG